jgi:hypothetical protein
MGKYGGKPNFWTQQSRTDAMQDSTGRTTSKQATTTTTKKKTK